MAIQGPQRGAPVAPTLPAGANHRILFPDGRLLKDRRQTVIRVRGHEELKPGDLVDAVIEGWQLSLPIKLKPVARLRVAAVRQEALRTFLDDPAYAERELSLEGVSRGISPKTYVAKFLAQFSDLGLDTEITRIEFTYV